MLSHLMMASETELITNPKAVLSQLCKNYYPKLKTLLDKHLPVRSNSVKVKQSARSMSL